MPPTPIIIIAGDVDPDVVPGLIDEALAAVPAPAQEDAVLDRYERVLGRYERLLSMMEGDLDRAEAVAEADAALAESIEAAAVAAAEDAVYADFGSAVRFRFVEADGSRYNVGPRGFALQAHPVAWSYVEDLFDEAVLENRLEADDDVYGGRQRVAGMTSLEGLGEIARVASWRLAQRTSALASMGLTEEQALALSGLYPYDTALYLFTEPEECADVVDLLNALSDLADTGIAPFVEVSEELV